MLILLQAWKCAMLGYVAFASGVARADREADVARASVRETVENSLAARLRKSVSSSDQNAIHRRIPKSLLLQIETLHLLSEPQLDATMRSNLLQYASEITDAQPGRQDVVAALNQTVLVQIKRDYLNHKIPAANAQRERLLAKVWGSAVFRASGYTCEVSATDVAKAGRELLQLLQDDGMRAYEVHAKMLVQEGYPGELLDVQSVREQVLRDLAPTGPVACGSECDVNLRRAALTCGLNYYSILGVPSCDNVSASQVAGQLSAVHTRDGLLRIARAVQTAVNNREVQVEVGALLGRCEDVQLLYELCYCVGTAESNWTVEFMERAADLPTEGARLVPIQVLSLLTETRTATVPPILVALFRKPSHADTDKRVCGLLRHALQGTSRHVDAVRDGVAGCLAKRLESVRTEDELEGLLDVAFALKDEWAQFWSEYAAVAERGLGVGGMTRYWELMGAMACRDPAALQRALDLSTKHGHRESVLRGIDPPKTASGVVALVKEEAATITNRETLACVSRFLTVQDDMNNRWSRSGVVEWASSTVASLEKCAGRDVARRLEDDERGQLLARVSAALDLVDKFLGDGDLRERERSELNASRMRLTALRDCWLPRPADPQER